MFSTGKVQVENSSTGLRHRKCLIEYTYTLIHSFNRCQTNPSLELLTKVLNLCILIIKHRLQLGHRLCWSLLDKLLTTIFQQAQCQPPDSGQNMIVTPLDRIAPLEKVVAQISRAQAVAVLLPSTLNSKPPLELVETLTGTIQVK